MFYLFVYYTFLTKFNFDVRMLPKSSKLLYKVFNSCKPIKTDYCI